MISRHTVVTLREDVRRGRKGKRERRFVSEEGVEDFEQSRAIGEGVARARTKNYTVFYRAVSP